MDAKAFLEGLAERYPSDAEDLEHAWTILHQQRIHTVDRLTKLGDSQWTRLNIPMGVEAIIREELNAAVQQQYEPAPQEESTLRQRKKSGGLTMRSPKRQETQAQRPAYDTLFLDPPANLDAQWNLLLVDTLPPDRRDLLQKSWNELAGRSDEQYMMFLEYSSYLRKPEIKQEDRERHEQKIEPLLRELGIPQRSEPDHDGNAGLWWIGMGAIAFFGFGFYYYFYGGHSTVPHQELL
eukprot:GEMP01074686.1.p1 GENE.GEMP01074686.1~~GEMP01074686.1.p1  ORF type:complete len:237 (+),score=51.02 GEMP01074686.1:59-769(+)